MKTHKIGENMTQETRVALLEQSIGHINQTLVRIENRLDKIDDKIDSKFSWLLALYLGGFGALFGMMAHAMHWL